MPGARGKAFSPQGAKTFSWEGRGGASAWGGGEMARPVMEGQRNRRETGTAMCPHRAAGL